MVKRLKAITISVMLVALLAACTQEENRPAPTESTSSPTSTSTQKPEIDPDTPELGWTKQLPAEIRHKVTTEQENPYGVFYSAEKVSTIPKLNTLKNSQWVYVETTKQPEPFKDAAETLRKHYKADTLKISRTQEFSKAFTQYEGDIVTDTQTLYFTSIVGNKDGYAFVVIAPTQDLRNQIIFDFDPMRIPLS